MGATAEQLIYSNLTLIKMSSKFVYENKNLNEVSFYKRKKKTFFFPKTLAYSTSVRQLIIGNIRQTCASPKLHY